MESKKQPRPTKVDVEIVIYGLRKDMDAIGNFLSEGGFYLQHPMECDTRVPYVNPQYLLRPGSQMPKIQNMTSAATVRSTSVRESLDETRTKQLLQVFDYAEGPTTFGEVKPSLRLRTQLQE